jgi:hypothetical protein
MGAKQTLNDFVQIVYSTPCEVPCQEDSVVMRAVMNLR